MVDMHEDRLRELPDLTPPDNDFNNPSQWSMLPDNVYFPTYPTIPTLDAGIYEVVWVDNIMSYGVKKQNVISDDLIDLPIEGKDIILSDIHKFWESEEQYKKLGATYKRGILMYGPPGSGKTTILRGIFKYLIEEKDGIIFNLGEDTSMSGYASLVCDKLRSVEPNRPIVTIIEDIDKIVDSREFATLLSILDGLKQTNNIVHIATTNYPEHLRDTLTNRPGRFDRKIKIGLPNDEVRESYISQKLDKITKSKKSEIKKWVKETEGLSIAHIKELVTSVCILEEDFDYALNNIRNLSKFVSSSDDRGNSLGFGSM